MSPSILPTFLLNLVQRCEIIVFMAIFLNLTYYAPVCITNASCHPSIVVLLIGSNFYSDLLFWQFRRFVRSFSPSRSRDPGCVVCFGVAFPSRFSSIQLAVCLLPSQPERLDKVEHLARIFATITFLFQPLFSVPRRLHHTCPTVSATTASCAGCGLLLLCCPSSSARTSS